MALSAVIEKNESWKFRETAEGQEFVRVFYAPWADVFSIGGPSSSLPAIGDEMPTAVMVGREDLKVISIIADPQQRDLEGCNVEITYSNVTKDTYPKKIPNSRLSWDERFYSVNNIIEVDQYINEAVTERAEYTGGEFTKAHLKDEKGNSIPQPIEKHGFIYDLTVRVSAIDVEQITQHLKKVNDTNFFVGRGIVTGQQTFQNKEGVVTLAANDRAMWRYNNANITREGVNMWAVNMEFEYNADKWNDTTRDGGKFYLEADFSYLLDLAASEAPPTALGGSR